jgi:hypothetical protein
MVRELVGADGVPDMRQKALCVWLGELPHDFRHAVGAFPLVYDGASRDNRWNHLGGGAGQGLDGSGGADRAS